MNQNAKAITRRRVLWLVASLILGIYALLSLGRAGRAAERLAQVRADRQEIANRLTDISRLKAAPKVAALKLESPAEIANRISAARVAAGMPQSALLKEQPLEPVRIDRSDFEQRVTDISLSAATLPQIITFCEALHDEETGTVVRDLTLRVPSAEVGGENGEKWEAQLALTQMIFSPKSR